MTEKEEVYAMLTATVPELPARPKPIYEAATFSRVFESRRDWIAYAGAILAQLQAANEKLAQAESAECVVCRDYETNILGWIEQLGGDVGTKYHSLELERLIDAAEAKLAAAEKERDDLASRLQGYEFLVPAMKETQRLEERIAEVLKSSLERIAAEVNATLVLYPRVEGVTPEQQAAIDCGEESYREAHPPHPAPAQTKA